MCYKNPGYMCEVVKADTVCSGEDDGDDAAAVLKFDRKKRDVEGNNGTDTVSFNFTFKLDPYFYKDSHACDDMLCREKFETLLEVKSSRLWNYQVPSLCGTDVTHSDPVSTSFHI